MKSKVRLRRDPEVVATRLLMVQKSRSGVMPLEQEILLSLGFTQEEVAWACSMSVRQVSNWVRNGVLTPLAVLGRTPVFRLDDVVGVFQ